MPRRDGTETFGSQSQVKGGGLDRNCTSGNHCMEVYLKPRGQDETIWGVSIERKEGSLRPEPWMLLG